MNFYRAILVKQETGKKYLYSVTSKMDLINALNNDTSNSDHWGNFLYLSCIPFEEYDTLIIYPEEAPIARAGKMNEYRKANNCPIQFDLIKK